MTRAKLERASNLLKDAAGATEGDVRGRLYEQSDQLVTLVIREQGPDHGRSARHMTVPHGLAEDLDGDAAETVREARSEVLEYRKGVLGVRQPADIPPRFYWNSLTCAAR